MKRRPTTRPSRRAAVIVLFLFCLIGLLGMMAFAVDVGYIVLVRTQLQAAADSAAMAAAAQLGTSTGQVVNTAQEYAGFHSVGGKALNLGTNDVEFGLWDATTRTFTPTTQMANAVRVTTRRDNGSVDGSVPLFFGRVFNRDRANLSASAVAMANPRDIAFVVDLSGSMNDDSEPCWATTAINSEFSGGSYSNVGTALVQAMYDDFGFGTYPGASEYLGQPFNVGNNGNAYTNLTKNGGPLTTASIPSQYRISSGNSETVRKQKAYSWVIDNQIARIMPAAKPTPSSATNFSYWEKYLDYIARSANVSGRGTLPPNQYGQLLTGMNNPNKQSFPDAVVPNPDRNQINYKTYLQFMLDHGRDQAPVGSTYTPLSRHSNLCPYHNETTPGGTFSFPPREQPTHASRRALIAAIQVVKERNLTVPDPNQRDWVSVIRFDKLNNGSPVVEQALTSNYDAAMQACTTLQAVSDIGSSTGTESGLQLAKTHLKTPSNGGSGRASTNKVVVLLTDGMPNLYSSSNSAINTYRNANPSSNFYGGSNYAYDSALMQTGQMQTSHWRMYPVGLGLGTDYGFMDRLARMGNTANEDGESARGTGNPAEYEQQLASIFEQIITTPQARLVQ